MSILTIQQIQTIKDDTVKRLFILHNKPSNDDIMPTLTRGLILEGSYEQKIKKLYEIYTGAEHKKWCICHVGGLKTLMIQKGITKIRCFGCDSDFHFNELESILFIRIYKQADKFYVCCAKCAPICPTIDMVPSDAQRFYIAKRGNIQVVLDEQRDVETEILRIKDQINKINETKQTLQQTAEELETDILLLEQSNMDKITKLEKAANHEKHLLNETEKQSALIKSINDTETQTQELKAQYEKLFEEQFKVAKNIEEVNKSIENMKEDVCSILAHFETNMVEKTEEMMNNLTKKIGEKTKEIVGDMDKIESTSDTIVEKLSYNFKCGVCMGRKDPIWAFDCGHTLCGVCKDELNKCPICSTETAEKRQIYM